MYPSVSEIPQGDYNTTLLFGVGGNVGEGTIQGLQVCLLNDTGEPLKRVTIGTFNISDLDGESFNVTTNKRPREAIILASDVRFVDTEEDTYGVVVLGADWENGYWTRQTENATQWQYSGPRSRARC